MRWILLPFLTATAAPAVAQNWNNAGEFTVTLSNFEFEPEVIHLRAGEPVRLRLVNRGSGGHDFTAPAFFAAAKVKPSDAAAIDEGSVEVEGGRIREIELVPAAGRYKLKCTHAFHKLFGMSGEIIVE